MLKKVALLLAFTLALAGCTLQAPKHWTAGTGPIKIVTSTDVWGSIANLVAGDTATVTSLISNTNQDPHSFEASARDQLLVDQADIVVMNGGGYDDFLQKMVDADSTPAVTVDAFRAVGAAPNQNEHIWYDVDHVADAAAAIAAAVENFRANYTATVEANLTAFKSQLADRKATLGEIRAAGICGRVFATEPLVNYLLEDAGCVNVTPKAYSNAIEEERDVPPSVMQESLSLVKHGLSFIAANGQVSTTQIEQLERGSDARVFGFSELLPQDPVTLAYKGDYFDMLDSAITMIGGKK